MATRFLQNLSKWKNKDNANTIDFEQGHWFSFNMDAILEIALYSHSPPCDNHFLTGRGVKSAS